MNSKKQWLAIVGSIFAAALLLVGVVLPAEYALDPLGSGRALGLLGLSNPGPVAVVQADQPHFTDKIQFQLLPFESVEYSYRMHLDASMIYSWQATDELVFNLHSSPDLPGSGAPADYAESFSAGRDRGEQGTYTATFNGRHGWFWENRTDATVRLQLSVAGFVSAPLRSSVSGQEAHELTPAL